MYLKGGFAAPALVAIATVCTSAQQAATPGVRAPTGVPRTLTGGAGVVDVHVLCTIQGNALTATDAPLPNAPVRLRDARFGRIVSRQLTDQSGMFSFRNVDPGLFVVELLSDDARTLAASQLLGVNAGESRSTFVKLPFRVSSYTGLFRYLTPQAVAVTTAAAASGVLASSVTGAVASPQ